MAIKATLGAEKREGTRKGANRKLRATGRVPAVLYGQGGEAVTLSVDAREATHLFQQISVENTIIQLKVKGEDDVQALVREVQVAAVRPDLVHIDFYKVQKGVKLEVNVPVELVGTPAGVKNDGGILEQVIHEVAVRCLPDAIPERIDIDVTALEMHGSLHISDLSVPDGVEILDDPEQTLCVVSMPRLEVEPVAAVEAPVTEVIGAEPTEPAATEEEKD
jgi:large subunit ribosomal protein L25